VDRAERSGLAIAALGHALVLALLSASFLAKPLPPPPPATPVDISLVDDVALTARAPQSTEAPAPSVAPEQGPPEAAAPPAPEPEPAPPLPTPAPRPPAPAPSPEPAKPKPAPAKPAPPKPSPTQAAPAKAAGTDASAAKSRPRGARLGPDFLKGLADTTERGTAATPRAVAMSARAAADIGSAILRQIQPCADRQVNPGPGAERIRVTIRLALNRDGSLAARPVITDHQGVDDENRRYVARVDDLAIASFVGCAPLRGLPDDLYDVPNGWRMFSLRYKLPG